MTTATTPVTTPDRPKIAKPAIPWEGFPLYWHSRGYWMKKHRGRELRFTADAQQSFDLWRDLLEGEKRGERGGRRKRYLLRDAINLYLTRQKKRYDEGELSAVQFAKCRFELQSQLPMAVPLSTPLEDLNANDVADAGPGALFARIRAKASKRGLQACQRHVIIVRAMLDYAARKHLMRAPDYGDDFDPPSQARIDKDRHARDLEHGARSWTIPELRKLLDAAKTNTHLRAQMLLGLFAAFGSDDCSSIPEKALDRAHHVHTFPRVKNGRPRCAYLPDVVWKAIDLSLKERAPGKTPEARHLLFRTSNGTKCNAAKGKSDELGLLSAGRNDTIGRNFKRLVTRVKLNRPRAGFKTLRAMCRTMLVGAGVSDDIVSVIMGRKFRYPVDEYYLRGDLRNELVKASVHIESQLFPTSQTQARPRASRSAASKTSKPTPARPRRQRASTDTARARTRG